MKTKYLLTFSVAAVCALTVLSIRVHANAIAYTVTDLGNLPGVTASYSEGINASGQVVGYLVTAVGNVNAVEWTGTAKTNLNTPGSFASYGQGINASGEATGYALISGSSGITNHAIRWAGGTATDLGNLGGSSSQGYAINGSGQVAGSAAIAGNSATHAVRWTGTTATDLGTLGGTNSQGYGINNSGQIAGYSQITGSTAFHAVRWTGMTPTDLGTLGGTYSQGISINVSGQIVGYADTASGTSHAVLWTGIALTDLGVGTAFGLNSFGDVIGMSGSTAFLYTSGTRYDLNTLVVPGSGVTGLSIFNQGNSINDSGQIAAYGTIGGQTHALRLDPVATPEPTSAVLVFGAGALIALRRRRKQCSMSDR